MLLYLLLYLISMNVSIVSTFQATSLPVFTSPIPFSFCRSVGLSDGNEGCSEKNGWLNQDVIWGGGLVAQKTIVWVPNSPTGRGRFFREIGRNVTYREIGVD